MPMFWRCPWHVSVFRYESKAITGDALARPQDISVVAPPEACLAEREPHRFGCVVAAVTHFFPRLNLWNALWCSAEQNLASERRDLPRPKPISKGTPQCSHTERRGAAFPDMRSSITLKRSSRRSIMRSRSGREGGFCI